MISKQSEFYKQAILEHLAVPLGVHLAQNGVVRAGYNSPAVHRHLYHQIMSGITGQTYNKPKDLGVMSSAAGILPEASILSRHAKHVGQEIGKVFALHGIDIRTIRVRDTVLLRRAAMGDFSWAKNKSFIKRFGAVLPSLIPGYNAQLHNILLTSSPEQLNTLIGDLNNVYKNNPLTNNLVKGIGRNIGKAKLTNAVSTKAQNALQTAGKVLGTGAMAIADPMAASVNAGKDFLGNSSDTWLQKRKGGDYIVRLKNYLNKKFVTEPVEHAWKSGLEGKAHVSKLKGMFDKVVINPMTAHTEELANSFGKVLHNRIPGISTIAKKIMRR